MNDCIHDENLRLENGIGCPYKFTDKCSTLCDQYLSPDMVMKALIENDEKFTSCKKEISNINNCIHDVNLKLENGTGCQYKHTDRCNDLCKDYLTPDKVIKALKESDKIL